MKLLLAASALLAACATTNDGPPWLFHAVGQARDAHKPLVVEFYTKWCGPCQTFEAKVLPDPRVQEQLSRVMFVRYDAEERVGRDAAARCRINAYPTFLGIDREGTIRLLKKGAQDTPDD